MMKTLTLLILAGGAMPRATYTLQRGSEKGALTAVFAKDGTLASAEGFDLLPGPVSDLPLRLDPALRKIGAVIFDDGQGFKHDKGKLAFTLTSTGVWKTYRTLQMSYGYQGMQEEDHWTLEAGYDAARGHLLTARLLRRLGTPQVTFEMSIDKLG